MHKYYLLTPQTNSPNIDPGVTFITHGCKYLIRQADPEALFLSVSNTEYSKPNWDLLLDQADCLVLAGNPLYDPSDVHTYWNYSIWNHVNGAQSRGIPIADLWGYSSSPIPAPDFRTMAEQLLINPKNKRVLDIQSRFNLIITRDITAQLVASSMRDDVDALPCCAYWAFQYFNVTPKEPQFNCVTIRYRQGLEYILQPLYDLAQKLSNQRLTYILCHTAVEYWWAKKNLPSAQNLICIYDPKSLLEFYSRCDKVISIRLHGTIPALSLGRQVINISIDTRSQALDLFKIPSIPSTALKNRPVDLTFKTLQQGIPESPSYFIKRFQDAILSRL